MRSLFPSLNKKVLIAMSWKMTDCVLPSSMAGKLYLEILYHNVKACMCSIIKYLLEILQNINVIVLKFFAV